MIKKLQFYWIMAGLVCLSSVLIREKAFGSAQQDSLKEEVTTLRDRVSGFEERLATAETNLEKLTRIKLSGYIQAQWEYFENPAVYPQNYFSIRRARLKVQYKPAEGVIFVLQPDLSPSGFTLKDAYVQLNDPWLKTFSLWAGQFNRPDYEVEYSSSKREVPERSRVIRALYPGERAIGAKLEVAPPSFPIKFQFAVLNGNDHLSIKDINGEEINPKNRDFDNYKDLMARLTYNVRLGNIGGLDFGVSGYWGWIKSNSTVVLNSDYSLYEHVTEGQSVGRHWFGGEMQLYLDFLGGMAVKAEYLAGINAYPGSAGNLTVSEPVETTLVNDTLTMTYLTVNTGVINPAIRRSFTGGYIYLIKNIGKRNQFAFRWDFYDPNSSLKADRIGVVKYSNNSSETFSDKTIEGSDPVVVLDRITQTDVNSSLKSGTADIAYQTLTFAWNYYFTDNIRIQAAYEIPFNEKVGVDDSGKSNLTKKYTVNGETVINDYSTVFPQSVVTLRLQVKF